MKFATLSPLRDLLYFTTATVAQLDQSDSLHNIKIGLSLATKSKKLIRVMKDVYIFADNFSYRQDPYAYLASVACSIKFPSYVSLEYVLNQHHVFTDGRFGLTLITTHHRSLHQVGNYSIHYHRINPDLFTGYSANTDQLWPFNIATKSKAMFDWIYLYANHMPKIQKDTDVAEELRLNLEAFTSKDFDQMRRYAKLAWNKNRIEAIINNLEESAPHHS